MGVNAVALVKQASGTDREAEARAGCAALLTTVRDPMGPPDRGDGQLWVHLTMVSVVSQ